jgi:hypothetical protein
MQSWTASRYVETRDPNVRYWAKADVRGYRLGMMGRSGRSFRRSARVRAAEAEGSSAVVGARMSAIGGGKRSFRL